MEVLFVKGSGPCPDCGVILRKGQFRDQLFDDPFYEREVDIRKRILKDYCKTEEDFATLREFNDYLEEIEHIVFNLVKNTDVVETNKKIEQYKKENMDQIKRARILGNPRIHELDAILEEERLAAAKRNFENTVLEQEELRRKLKSKEALIDNLMFSDTDANVILKDYKLKTEQEDVENKALMETKRAEFLAAAVAASKITDRPTNANVTKPVSKPGHFSTGVSIGGAPPLKAPQALPVKEELFVYEEIQYHHPNIPTIEDIKGKKYACSYRETTEEELAGGYHVCKSVHRGLLDIFTPEHILFDPETEGITRSDVSDGSDEAKMDTN
jgi:CDK-activating kinase assembly factor MAT1